MIVHCYYTTGGGDGKIQERRKNGIKTGNMVSGGETGMVP